MLNQMTLNRLHEMKLSAMAEKYRTIAASAAEGQLSFDEWFGLLVDAEWDHRHTNRIARLMKKATLYFPNASVEDIEYRSDRKLNRNLLQELGTLQYTATPNYKTIQMILKTGSDLLKEEPETKGESYAFTRGAAYYGGGEGKC